LDKIKVKVKFVEYVPFLAGQKPKAIVINIKREGKDGFESSVKIPIGDVSAEEFAKGAKVLQLVAHSFYHQQYAHLREMKEEKDGEES